MHDDPSMNEWFLQELARLHDDPGKYKTAGHDGVDAQWLLPGGVMYEGIADDPERFKAFCEERREVWHRPTTRTRISRPWLPAWVVWVFILVGVGECIKCWASMVAYLWGLL